MPNFDKILINGYNNLKEKQATSLSEGKTVVKQAKIKITEIPEGQLFKWNRVIYKKTDKTRAIDTRTGKETVFYDGCKGLLVSDK